MRVRGSLVEATHKRNGNWNGNNNEDDHFYLIKLEIQKLYGYFTKYLHIFSIFDTSHLELTCLIVSPTYFC